MRFPLVLLLSLGTLFLKALPTDSTKKRFDAGLIIKTDVFALAHNYRTLHYRPHLSRYYSFTIEKLLAKRHSIQLSFLYGPWYNNNFFDRSAVIPEYKFYVGRKKPQAGYYVGANLKYIHYYEKTSNVLPQTASDTVYYGTYTSKTFNIGVINGIQFYVARRITLDLYCGIGFNFMSSEKIYQAGFLGGFDHLYPFALGPDYDLRFGFNLGFRI